MVTFSPRPSSRLSNASTISCSHHRPTPGRCERIRIHHERALHSYVFSHRMNIHDCGLGFPLRRRSEIRAVCPVGSKVPRSFRRVDNSFNTAERERFTSAALLVGCIILEPPENSLSFQTHMANLSPQEVHLSSLTCYDTMCNK
jgi:hypothetical protein